MLTSEKLNVMSFHIPLTMRSMVISVKHAFVTRALFGGPGQMQSWINVDPPSETLVEH